MSARRIDHLSLIEKRSGPGSEGWPRCIQIWYDDSTWPVEVIIRERCEYSAVAQAVSDINAAIVARK